jgi:transposase-like protein
MKQTKPNKDKDIVTIGDEWTGEERPSYICNFCSRNLVKLTDRSGKNESYYCNSCGIDFQPENVRRETKLSVPDRNTETLAATTPGIPDISIHHTPEPKGTFKVLQQKGIKIKDYKETDGAGRNISYHHENSN